MLLLRRGLPEFIRRICRAPEGGTSLLDIEFLSEEEEDELSSSVEQRGSSSTYTELQIPASDSNLKQYMSLSTRSSRPRYHNVQDKFASREQRQEAFYINYMVDSIQDLMVTAGEASTRSELVDLQRNHPKTSHHLQRSIRAIFALNFVARLNSFTDLRGRADPPNLYWSQVPDCQRFLGIAIVSNMFNYGPQNCMITTSAVYRVALVMLHSLHHTNQPWIGLSGNKKLCKMYESFDPSLRFPPPEFLVLCNLLVVGKMGETRMGKSQGMEETTAIHRSLLRLTSSKSHSSLNLILILTFTFTFTLTLLAAPVSLIHQHHSSIHLQKESRNRTQMIEGSPS
ncbi:hypothetical protein CCUS01_03219 [Colletotrichum cuscutae]|uniref:Uncharacterized protein n=1 Tax=Colletotrichum cuscutae TaxID=1209917 RepID=A0AAI9Y9J1_9PEZI|nr:hypothetical protein CCUS01_03219 [Colletotrichum cuscutae]